MTNPVDTCMGKEGNVVFCQGGATVTGVGMCGLTGGGDQDVYTAGFCRLDVSSYSCEKNNGYWQQDSQWAGHNEFTCKYPFMIFKIFNQLSYSIDAYGYTGYIGAPGYVNTGINLSPGDSFKTPQLEVSLQIASQKQGSAGSLMLFNSFSEVRNVKISVANPIIDNNQWPGKLHMINDDSYHSNLGCLINPQESQWSNVWKQGKPEPASGVSYLYSNIIVSKIQLCVSNDIDASGTYKFLLKSFSSLETQDSNLYPPINEANKTTPISEGMDLGSITFKNTGTLCLTDSFIFKTKEGGSCEDMITNNQGSTINAANLIFAVEKPDNTTAIATLSLKSSVTQQDNNVDVKYSMVLTQTQGKSFELTPNNGDNNIYESNNGLLDQATLTFLPGNTLTNDQHNEL